MNPAQSVVVEGGGSLAGSCMFPI